VTKKLIIIFLLTCKTICGQTDSTNQVDLKGKKNGYWLQYLDQRLNPIDSANAYYKGFEFYDHGTLVYKFNEFKWSKLDTIVRTHPLPVKGQPILVSGRLMWFSSSKDSIPNEIRDFSDGHPIYEKCNHQICRPNLYWNLSSEILDYTKRYQNLPGTHYYYVINYDYPDNGNKSVIRHKSWYYKKKSKWKYHRL